MWKAVRTKASELACLCDFRPGGRDAVESQVEAVGHVLAVAKVVQEADVHQVVVGAGLPATTRTSGQNLICEALRRCPLHC